MRGLLDEVAIVTGGGGGMGRAIGLRFAAEGAVVGVFDRDAGTADATVREIEKAGGAAHAVEVDLTDYAAVSAAVTAFEEEVGPTSVLVNNVGWDRFLPFLETTPELWDQLVGVNLFAHLNVLHRVLPGMKERKRGKVVMLASDAGRVGGSREAVYSACKGAMIALGKALAREHAREGICVNSVCPGPTHTPLLESVKDEPNGEQLYEALRRAIPFRRFGDPADIAGIVVFLCSDEASYITGQSISVSGGLTMHG